MKTPTSVVIEKCTIIKALQTENLERGSFFNIGDTMSDADFLKQLKTCPVCAVGATLRKTAGPKTLMTLAKYRGVGVSEIAYETCDGRVAVKDTLRLPPSYRKQAKALIRSKNYTGALSVFFERDRIGTSEVVTKEDRAELIAFVREHFPTRFKLEL